MQKRWFDNPSCNFFSNDLAADIKIGSGKLDMLSGLFAGRQHVQIQRIRCLLFRRCQKALQCCWLSIWEKKWLPQGETGTSHQKLYDDTTAHLLCSNCCSPSTRNCCIHRDDTVQRRMEKRIDPERIGAYLCTPLAAKEIEVFCPFCFSWRPLG